MSLHYKNREVHIFNSSNQITAYAVEKWAEIAEKAVKKKGYFTAALSGGKTPIDLFQKLADLKKPLPWNKTHIFIVDERFVPFIHNESNYRMINHALLSRIAIPSEHIHPIMTDTENPRISAERYEDKLTSFFKLKDGDFPGFDLIILGIGEDGHTASLFPGTASIKERDHSVVAVLPPDMSKKERITLTFPVINKAGLIIFLISGKNKAKVVKQVLENDSINLPASMVKPDKGRLLFFIDEDAGSLLSKKIKQ